MQEWKKVSVTEVDTRKEEGISNRSGYTRKEEGISKRSGYTRKEESMSYRSGCKNESK